MNNDNMPKGKTEIRENNTIDMLSPETLDNGQNERIYPCLK